MSDEVYIYSFMIMEENHISGSGFWQVFWVEYNERKDKLQMIAYPKLQIFYSASGTTFWFYTFLALVC